MPSKATAAGMFCPQHRYLIKHNGFTLIELVTIVVILGILAIVAIPKFVDLGNDARVNSVKTLASALQNATNDIRMLCAVSSGCNLGNDQQHIYLHNQWYWLNYGWVDAGDDIGVDEIDVALSTNGFVISLPNIYSTLFSLADAPTPANCSVLYYQATIGAPNPVITTITSGC